VKQKQIIGLLSNCPILISDTYGGCIYKLIHIVTYTTVTDFVLLIFNIYHTVCIFVQFMVPVVCSNVYGFLC